MVVVAALVLLHPLLVFRGRAARPDRTDYATSLAAGIEYRRVVADHSVVHILDIDLSADKIHVFVTPADAPGQAMFMKARTTTDFIDEFDAVAAVNASYFFPFKSNHYLDYYPHSGDPVRIIGTTISDGRILTDFQSDSNVPVCFSRSVAEIAGHGICPPGTEEAVSGNGWIVQDGSPVVAFDHFANEIRFPRTALGLSESGSRLWLVVVDGKQGSYSEGFTVLELADYLVGLGIDSAIALDGGGSATMAASVKDKPTLMSSPSQTGIPMRQRPVANHIGVMAQQDYWRTRSLRPP